MKNARASRAHAQRPPQPKQRQLLLFERPVAAFSSRPSRRVCRRRMPRAWPNAQGAASTRRRWCPEVRVARARDRQTDREGEGEGSVWVGGRGRSETAAVRGCRRDRITRAIPLAMA
eukprot:2087088-Pleurochrysis_carterae.AAC.1